MVYVILNIPSSTFAATLQILLGIGLKQNFALDSASPTVENVLKIQSSVHNLILPIYPFSIMIVVQIPGLIQISQLAPFLGCSDAFYSGALLWHKEGFNRKSVKMQATYEAVFPYALQLVLQVLIIRIVLLAELGHPDPNLSQPS